MESSAVEIDIDQVQLNSLSSHSTIHIDHFDPKIAQIYGIPLSKCVLVEKFFHEEDLQMLTLEEHEYLLDNGQTLVHL